MDKSSFGGVVLALAGILAGLLMEGGHVGQILQPTAAMIVLGGTLGAVMLQFPLATVGAACKRLAGVFFVKKTDSDATVKLLLSFANKARRSGIVSLDQDLPTISDSFLKQALMLAVDGTEPAELRKIMELQLDNQAQREEAIPSVFESAGGFAPTIGIIGAVMGLIQVMQHLDHIDEVGRGIAVAFVATIYGVASANLLFLPWAGKLRIRLRERQVIQEMTLEAVLSIIEGVNPRALQLQLNSFLATPDRRAPAKVTVQ